MGGVIAGLKALGPKRLLALGSVGLALLALLGVLAFRAGDTPMAPLFGELEPRDAAAVVAALERQRIPYRLAAGGAQVMAPLDQVPRLRLLLAREGLPAGGGLGWEIFDRDNGLTVTPFQQDVNKLRALEGELARTIRGLDGVRAARVHLVLPRREAFSRERGEAQASVVLTMQGAQRLDREGVQAVLHLVATAVPGLRPQNVSIVDSRGALLARGGQALAGPAAVQTQEEIRRAQELRLGRAVEELLERSLGPGRVRAEATVEMDFDRVETREERFDPDNQVPRSQQSVAEQTRGAEPQPTTVAGNLPGAEPPGGGATQESRQEETTNYEIGRSTRSTLREHPVVRRISVAVLVDGVAEPGEGGGPPRWRERPAEDLARIGALVRSAIGFDERRGDRVEVVSMRFVEEAPGEAPPERFLGLPVPPALATRLIESALLALVALAAILLLGRPVVGRLSASLAPLPALAGAEGAAALPGMVGGPAALPGMAAEGGMAALPPGADPAALPSGEESMVSLAHVQGQMRASSLNGLIQLVQRHPDESLAVLRRWLDPEDA
ncbi:flagellar basal-body MS-ring/collar protein FliF [Paracraurococcus lichenis]|uniref:Flagellar M-ring protein n=1 Tax=Paracraurococcus lichenis TaxID=3064888 RepID=A0ABT9E1I5_9PROT|nr:flagellar basal-body MS-ring/collar protein FliF [Paracraurococcus sp. LOR1-02]MDO9710019.1 flagellar basal-body MS-ring/collar protein FliF [Paracraurococcus sp. LOR1-02]